MMTRTLRYASVVCLAVGLMSVSGCTSIDSAAFGIGEPCLDDGCPANLVCDGQSQTCRLPITCEQLACVAHQICDNLPGELDEQCLPQCEPGWLWNEDQDICEEAPADCVEGSPRSILDRCAAQNRDCILTNLGRAECGPCAEGFVSEAGLCRARLTCAEKRAECDSIGRECVEPDDGGDARCAECPDDQIEVAGGLCVPRTCELGAVASVGDACAADFRTCLDDPALGAVCGDCLGAYLETPEGTCRAVRLCADVDCTLRGRTCTEGDARNDAECGPCRAGFDDVNGRCEAVGVTCDQAIEGGGPTLAEACAAEDRGCEGDACVGCADGLVEDPFTGVCRAPITCDDCSAQGVGCAEVAGVIACDPAACAELFKRDPASGACVAVATCADLQCAAGEACSPAAGNDDAYCRRDCGDTGVWNGQACAFCPPCDGPGDTGRVFPRPTRNGACVCETRDGYFATRGVQVASFACDADEDGWLRESARPAMRSLDPVIRENARCAVRTIDTFVMVNEAGTEHRLTLDQPIDLYESDRNDDDGILERARARRNFDRPFGAAGDLRLAARHLNSLTKYCHLLDTDYNDNGVADVEDDARRPLAPGRPADQAVFNRFAYFAELHRGFFEASAEDPQRGVYFITEKRRIADGPIEERVPLTYGDGVDPFWRDCTVERDVDFGNPRPVTMDFAEVEDDATVPLGATRVGMNHHSQFKCMKVAPSVEPRGLNEIARDWTPAEHVVNDCRLDGLGDAADNPADARFVCRTAGSASPGQVRWTAVPFEPYANAEDGRYVRGCVDECAELRAGKLGLDPCNFGPDVLRLPCEGAPDGFGRLVCFEACDQRDNDGNGVVDDPPPGFGALGSDCDTGRPGVCSQGEVICDADGVYSCRQRPNDVTGARAVDVCDGLDNDCDDVADEDAAVPLQQGELYQGLACTANEHLGQPRVGECAPSEWSCVGGGLICPELIQPVEEICNGLDDDCDGTNDNGLRIIDPIICQDPDNTCFVQGGLGICQTGVTACQQGAGGFEETCVPLIQPGEVAERCNGLDDDCDGIVDERPENGADNCARSFGFNFGTNRIAEAGGSEDDNWGRNDIEITTTLNVRQQGNEITVSTRVTLHEMEAIDNQTRGEWGASMVHNAGAPVAELVSQSEFEFVVIMEDENDRTVIDGGSQRRNDPYHRLTVGQAGNPVDYLRVQVGDDLPEAGMWIRGTVDYRIRVAPGVADCGNGIVEVGETCDDGNLCPADGCSPACLVE